MSTNKPKAVTPEKATPVSHKPYKTDDEKTSCTREHVSVMKAAPCWAEAITLVPLVDGWSATTDALEAKNRQITKVQLDLTTLETERSVIRSAWTADRRQVIAGVNAFCRGSGLLILQLGYDVRTASVAGEIEIPTGVFASSGLNKGEVQVEWNDDVSRHGFMVQFATDRDNPNTYAMPIPCPQSPFVLTDQTSGATLHFRVAAIDPSKKDHITEWSVWAAGNVK